MQIESANKARGKRAIQVQCAFVLVGQRQFRHELPKIQARHASEWILMCMTHWLAPRACINHKRGAVQLGGLQQAFVQFHGDALLKKLDG